MDSKIYPQEIGIRLAEIANLIPIKCSLPESIGNIPAYEVAGPSVWSYLWTPNHMLEDYIYRLTCRLQIAQQLDNEHVNKLLNQERIQDEKIAHLIGVADDSKRNY